MREAPEAHDDLAMQIGVACIFGVAGSADQLHRERLQRQILGVLERHVEEDPQRHGCRLIVTGGDGALRREARQTIGSEGVRRIPVDVARDLIEQEDQRQGTLRRLFPRRQFTPRCNMVSGFKPGAEQGVEAVVALEPLFRPGPRPEGDDVLRADAHGPEPAEHDWIIQERFRRHGVASLQNETGYPVRARMDDMKKVSAIALALLLTTAATAYAQQGEDRRGGRDRGGDRGSEQGDRGDRSGARRDRDGEPRGAAAPDSRPGGGRQQQAQPQPQPQYQPPAAAAPQQPAFTPRGGDRGGGGDMRNNGGGQSGRQPGGGGGGDRGGRGGGGEWRGGGQPGVAPVTPQSPDRGGYRGGQPNAPQPDAGRGPRGGGDNSGLSGGPGREGGRDGGRDWNGGGRGGQGQDQGAGQGQGPGQGRGGQGNWNGGGRGGDNDVNRGGGRPDGAGRGGDRGDWNDRGGGRGSGDSNRWSDNGRSRWNGDRNWDDNNRWRDRNGHTPGYGRNGYRDRDHGRHFYAPNIYRYQYYAQQRYRAGAYRYPSNWFVRSWVFGDYLPRGWYGNSYYLDWNYYGLPYPPIGCEWVRVGRDAVLVDVWTGQVLSVWYSLFY